MSQLERMSQLIPQLDYSLPESPASIVERREHLQVSNAGNAILGPSQQTQFTISSSDKVLDGEKTWFSLEMKTDTLGATPKAITDVIKSVEVIMNGQRVELIDDVGALETVMRRVMYSNNYRKYDNQPNLVYNDDRLNVVPNVVPDITATQFTNATLVIGTPVEDDVFTLEDGVEAYDTPLGRRYEQWQRGMFVMLSGSILLAH
jgi:hypothetical protein